MKHYLSVSAALIGLLGVTINQSAAANQTIMPQNSLNNLGWYAGLQVAQSNFTGATNSVNYSREISGLSTTLVANTTQTAGISYRLFLGNMFYQTNLVSLGAELGYWQLPEVKYFINNQFKELSPTATDINIKGTSSAIDLLGVMNYALSPKFSLIGKAGFASASTKISSNNGGNSDAGTSTSINQILPELSAGVGFNFNPNLGMQLAVTNIFGRSIPSSIESLNDIKNFPSVLSYSLALSYRF